MRKITADQVIKFAKKLSLEGIKSSRRWREYQNLPRNRKMITHFYPKDEVRVMQGRDAGRDGIIEKVLYKRQELIIKGINMKSHTKEIIEPYEVSPGKVKTKLVQKVESRPAPVPMRNVKLLDDSEPQKPTDVFFEDGERRCQTTQNVLPIPEDDSKISNDIFGPGPYDTPKSVVQHASFMITDPFKSPFPNDLRL